MLRGFLRRPRRGRAALLRLSKRLVAGCDWLSHTLVFYFGKPIPIFGKYDETFGKISCAVCVRIKKHKGVFEEGVLLLFDDRKWNRKALTEKLY